MDRNDIIASLKGTILNEADCDRLCNRLQNCNVRLVRMDGSMEDSNATPRGPTKALVMMQDDPSIARFEYHFSGQWRTAY